LKEWIRHHIVKLSIAIIGKYGRAELERVVTIRAEEMAPELAIAMVQRILKNEGFSHCTYCVRRFPLKKVNGHMVCPDHIQVASNQEPTLNGAYPR